MLQLPFVIFCRRSCVHLFNTINQTLRSSNQPYVSTILLSADYFLPPPCNLNGSQETKIVAPQAAITALLVAGLAQWVRIR